MNQCALAPVFSKTVKNVTLITSTLIGHQFGLSCWNGSLKLTPFTWIGTCKYLDIIFLVRFNYLFLYSFEMSCTIIKLSVS